MRLRIIVYCPEELERALGGEAMSERDRLDAEALSRKWFKDGMILTVEIDTEARTCVVVEESK